MVSLGFPQHDTPQHHNSLRVKPFSYYIVGVDTIGEVGGGLSDNCVRSARKFYIINLKNQQFAAMIATSILYCEGYNRAPEQF